MTLDQVLRPRDVDLHVSLEGRQDLCGQIYRQIRAAILDGRLPPGQALPSTRQMSARLAVSRNTASIAYDRLAAEGFVTGRAGVGTYVSDRIPAFPANGWSQPDAPGVPLSPREVWSAQPDPPVMSQIEPEFDFRAGVPDARLFPFSTWRALGSDDGATGCARQFDEAQRTDMESFRDFQRDIWVAGHDDDAITIFTTGLIVQGRDNIANILRNHFNNRNAVWTWIELNRAVDGCKTGTIVYDATYAIPSRNITLREIVSVTYTYKHGRWLSVIDQGTEIKP